MKRKWADAIFQAHLRVETPAAVVHFVSDPCDTRLKCVQALTSAIAKSETLRVTNKADEEEDFLFVPARHDTFNIIMRRVDSVTRFKKLMRAMCESTGWQHELEMSVWTMKDVCSSNVKKCRVIETEVDEEVEEEEEVVKPQQYKMFKVDEELEQRIAGLHRDDVAKLIMHKFAAHWLLGEHQPCEECEEDCDCLAKRVAKNALNLAQSFYPITIEAVKDTLAKMDVATDHEYGFMLIFDAHNFEVEI